MKTDKHSLFITTDEYNVLTNNSLISAVCTRQLGSAHERGDEVELTTTLSGEVETICEITYPRNAAQNAGLNHGLRNFKRYRSD